MLIPAIVPLLAIPRRLIVLVKPQFEVGRGDIGKGGIVRDPALHEQACARLRNAVEAQGLDSAIIPSPILGTEGNREFLLYGHD
jgi:23S rRNA (cytidine1920-2'-O)/16S rRNA (cytidine1409-2'-O)-methyltransferase